MNHVDTFILGLTFDIRIMFRIIKNENDVYTMRTEYKNILCFN